MVCCVSGENVEAGCCSLFRIYHSRPPLHCICCLFFIAISALRRCRTLSDFLWLKNSSFVNLHIAQLADLFAVLIVMFWRVQELHNADYLFSRVEGHTGACRIHQLRPDGQFQHSHARFTQENPRAGRQTQLHL